MGKNADESFAGNLGRLEPLLAKLRADGIGHHIAGQRVDGKATFDTISPVDKSLIARIARGTPADIKIHAEEVLAMTRRMAEILAKHTGQPFEQVMLDIDRDRFMTPGEAVEYGLVDKIVEPRAVVAA